MHLPQTLLVALLPLLAFNVPAASAAAKGKGRGGPPQAIANPNASSPHEALQPYIVHVDQFSPHMSDAVEARVLQEFRWWPISELANTRERLTPLSLGEIMARYLAHGPPAELPELEVLAN